MATTTFTARQLNRATLRRQLLLERASMPVVEAVNRVTALQAQEAASPYLALWNRLTGFDPAELDAAYASYAVIKATLIRVTLHAVGASDYAAFHEGMLPTLRGARLYDRRFKSAGMSIPEAEAFVPEVLAFTSEPRTNAEAEAWMDERLGEHPKPSVWWAFRQWGPFVHAPTGGPWSFGPRPSYVAAPEQRRSGDEAGALRVLARRYLEGFGPASVGDIGQFTMLSRPLVRAALEAQADELVRLEGPGGEALWDVPDGLRVPEDTPAPPRLLGMWDEVLLAYSDRSRTIPPEYRTVVNRTNGDVLPTLLVDGYVAGVWRPVEGGIEASAFHRLDDDAWAGLEAEARALIAFLADRDPNVYSRFGHWWAKLPKAAEVRRLGA